MVLKVRKGSPFPECRQMEKYEDVTWVIMPTEPVKEHEWSTLDFRNKVRWIRVDCCVKQNTENQMITHRNGQL